MTDPSPIFPPELQPRYFPRSVLGVGGMGAVWLVEDRELSRPAALKVMLSNLDSGARARFKREAQVLAGIRHPNIVEVLDFGFTREGPFLVMELLEGEPMDRSPRGSPFLDYFYPLADALQQIHSSDLVHRDVKPGNLFRTRQGRTVLMDFGLVRNQAQGATVLTEEGSMLGTLLFQAPELFLGSSAEAPADWWAFGVSLFLLYQRRYPYSFEALLDLTKGKELPALDFGKMAPDSPPRRVIEACLQPDPDRRPGCSEDIRRLSRSRSRREGSQPLLRSGLSSSAISEGAPGSRLRYGAFLSAVVAVTLFMGSSWLTSGPEAPGSGKVTSGPSEGHESVKPEDETLARLRALNDWVRLRGSELSKDPVDRWQALDRLPDAVQLVEVVHDLSSRGDLSSDLRRAVRRVDERLVGLELSPLFSSPWEDDRGEEEASWPLQRTRKVVGPLGSVARTFLRALTLSEQFRAALDGEEEEGKRAREAPENLMTLRMGGMFMARDTLKGAMYQSRLRKSLCLWLRDLTTETRRLLRRCVVALRTQADAEILIPELLLDVSNSRISLAWYSDLAFTDSPILLPCLPRTPGGQLVAGLVLLAGENARQGSGVSQDFWQEKVRNHLLGVLEGPSEEGSPSSIRAHAARLLIRHLVRSKQPEEARRLYLREKSKLLEDSSWLYRVGLLKDVCRAYQGERGLEKPLLEEMIRYSAPELHPLEAWPCLGEG